MIPKPEPTEVNRLAVQAVELREKEGISILEAIQTVCGETRVPKTQTPLTIGNVRAYMHLLHDAVTDAVYAIKYHATEPAVLAELTDAELEVVRCNIINEQEERIKAQFGVEPPSEEGFPYTDAVDDQDGASELPPLGPEDRQ